MKKSRFLTTEAFGKGATMEPRWHQVTALFGGTFDPPHLGHREAVRGLFRFPGVGRVFILPSPIPPQKVSSATPEQRMEMARLNFSGTPSDPYPAEVTIHPIELERAQANPGRPSYTFDTLRELKSELPEIAFVIGTDQLAKLSTWHRFPELLGLCHWIVLERKLQHLEIASKTLQKWASGGLIRQKNERQWITRFGTLLQIVPTEAPGISSTAVRETLTKTGEPPENSLLPEVLAYLKLHRIYGTRRGNE